MRYVEGEGVSYLHRDQLNSVRAITDASGDRAKRTAYMPFGEGMDYNVDPAVAFETKGFIGERYDEDAGLQYLNARYYDPELGRFIQPDWFEVMEPGVGTNRYAYSFNDPVNLMDPGGNNFEPGGPDYGVDTNGDGIPDASGTSGWGVGGAPAARRGDPAIEGSFASGSAFAGQSSSLNGGTKAQVQSIVNSGLTSDGYARNEIDSTRASINGQLGAIAAVVPAGRIAKALVGSLNTAKSFKTVAKVKTVKSSPVLKTTVHGAQRLAGPNATRGGILSPENAQAVMQSGKTLVQSDGAIVSIVTDAANRSNVVIHSGNGIITTFQGLSQKSLGRLGAKYGWR